MYTKKVTAALLAVLTTALALTSCSKSDTSSNQSSADSSAQTQTTSEQTTDTDTPLAKIENILTEKQTDFAITAIENRDTYLDVTVPDYGDVLRIKSYLEVNGLNENLADVHTPKTDPDEGLVVSNIKVVDPTRIQEIVYGINLAGYDFGYSSSTVKTDKVEVYVCYEHNVEELKALLTECNVDLSVVEIKVGGGVRVNGSVETLRTQLNDKKADYNITDIKYISPPSASGVEALSIDLSDDTKLDDLIAYIKNAPDVSTMQVPISISGGEYNYYE